MDITEVSWAKLWCSVCTTVVMERSRAKLVCLVGYIDIAEGSMYMSFDLGV
jgi:hypothetical protein